MFRHVPVRRPRPDGGLFIDTLMGKRKDVEPRLVEYLVDDLVMRPIVTDLMGREWVAGGEDRATQRRALDQFIDFWHCMGYDFVRFEQGLSFTKHHLSAPDTAVGSAKVRSWADEHRGTIVSWDDFGRYPWPKVEEFDFFPLEYVSSHLPDGMGFITCHGGGPFEQVSLIFSLGGMCIAVYDDPGLVRAVAEKIGELMTAFYRHLLDLPNLLAIFPGDDMGFRTGTMISPAHLRDFILPWHKRFAAMAHERGLPYFLHSCGNILPIIDDLISDVGIDGKHSFEDAIIPIQEFQERFGDRIAVLGGVDVDLLAAGSPQAVRERTRLLMETCGERGRFAVGSGSSIASYIPVENYVSMLDEALDFRGGA